MASRPIGPRCRRDLRLARSSRRGLDLLDTKLPSARRSSPPRGLPVQEMPRPVSEGRIMLASAHTANAPAVSAERVAVLEDQKRSKSSAASLWLRLSFRITEAPSSRLTMTRSDSTLRVKFTGDGPVLVAPLGASRIQDNHRMPRSRDGKSESRRAPSPESPPREPEQRRSSRLQGQQHPLHPPARALAHSGR